MKGARKIRALRGMGELYLDSSMKFVFEDKSTKIPVR